MYAIRSYYEVGVATYIVSHLQGVGTELIAGLFTRTGFWDHVHSNPFSRQEWLRAVELAPTVKQDYYTVLSTRDCLPEVEELMGTDPLLRSCFDD